MNYFKLTLASLAALFVLTANADEFPKDSYETYKVKQDSEGFFEAKIPKVLVSNLRSGLLSLGENLASCKQSTGEYTNPLIGRTSKYQISSTSRGCKLELDSYGTHTYNCYLSSFRANKMSKAIIERVSTDEVLGDWSKAEKEVLFNSSLCQEK